MKIKLRSTLYHIMQRDAVWQLSEKMFHSTMLNDVESRCYIRLSWVLSSSCSSTAPRPTFEASLQRTKSPSNFGYLRIGDEQSWLFSVLIEFSHSFDQLNVVLDSSFVFSVVKGAAVVANFYGMNRIIVSSKAKDILRDVGVVIFLTASTLLGSARIPSCEATWPRNKTSVAANRHLSNLTRKLCCQNLTKIYRSRLLFSCRVFPKQIRPSKSHNSIFLNSICSRRSPQGVEEWREVFSPKTNPTELVQSRTGNERCFCPVIRMGGYLPVPLLESKVEKYFAFPKESRIQS